MRGKFTRPGTRAVVPSLPDEPVGSGSGRGRTGRRPQTERRHHMPVATRRELLEAGVHFGHQTKRWNPKMRRFLYGQRSGIYIIDLEQTLSGLQQAHDFLVDIGARNGAVLFVGTKKQAQEVVA